MLITGRLAVFLLALMVLLPSLALAQDDDPETRDGLLLHMSKGPDHPHQVLQPLTLAMKMQKMQPVRLFLDIDAIHVVRKDAEPVSHEAFDYNSRQLVERLVALGVGIHVCPTCMKVAGVTEDDLPDGVEVAGAGTFTDFTRGRIVTLDW